MVVKQNILALTVLWAGVVLVSACDGRSSTVDQFQNVSAGKPIRLCMTIGEDTAQQLSAGLRRVVLALIRHSATDTVTNLHVTADDLDAAFRTPLIRRKGFAAKTEDQAMRFLLPSLRGKARLLREVCYSVSLRGDAGATADVKLELSQELR